MAKKITELTALAAPDDADLLAVADVSGTETKKTTIAQLKAIFQTSMSASPLGVVSPAASGATATVNQNVPQGSLLLLNITSPAGEPATADAPYYLEITNGVNTEHVIVIGRSGAQRTLAGRTTAAYAAGPSTVAYAGIATSPSEEGLLPAQDWHRLRVLLAQVRDNITATSNPTSSDDADRGYVAGSTWVNTSTNTIFICADPANGAAVWTELGSSTLQAAYDGGETIEVPDGGDPVTFDAQQVAQPSAQIVFQTKYGPAHARGLAIAPAGFTGPIDMFWIPEVHPDDDTSGYSITISGGTAGPFVSGGALGGHLSFNAGQGNGGTGEQVDTTWAGNLRFGRATSNELLFGQETYGSLHTFTGSVTIESGLTRDGNLDIEGTLVVGGVAQFNSGVLAAAITRATTSDTTLSASADEFLLVGTGSGNRNITLPNPNTEAKFYIKKTTTDTNTITLVRFGSEQIEGTAASYALPGSGGSGKPAWTVISDGTHWWVL